MNFLKGYKTLLFNFVMFLVALGKSQGVDFGLTEEEVSAGTDYVLLGIGFVWMVGAFVLRMVTNSPIFKKPGQAGHARMTVIALLAALCIGAAVVVGLMAGCAHESATEQIIAQTGDPGTIALAAFADAQDAYIEAAQLYLPYQATLKPVNPDLDAMIIGYLKQANDILDQWEEHGQVPQNDKDAFRDYLRRVSIEAAKLLKAM